MIYKKLNLLINNPNEYLNGYTNFDPFAPNGSKLIQAEVSNLDEYIDKGECEEIRAINIISYFDMYRINEIVDNWIDKLKPEGILYISDLDIEEVMKAFDRNNITFQQLNLLLYGEQHKKWNFRKSGHSMCELAKALISKGLKIKQKVFNGFNFNITAIKDK